MNPFPISDDLVFVENAIFLPKIKTLIISDLQLGYEQQLRAIGHNVPYEQAKKMLVLLEFLIKQTNAKRLVINGDLKHEFGKISAQERHDVLMILSTLKKNSEIIVVKGNHDTITKPLTDELGIVLLDSWFGEGFYALHGHVLPNEKDPVFKAAHTVIIGHVHPALTIDDGVRKERFKCFLVTKHKKKRLIVLPSFSQIVEGSNILKVASNSPLLQEVDSGRVYVLADEIRDFGKVSELRYLLG